MSIPPSTSLQRYLLNRSIGKKYTSSLCSHKLPPWLSEKEWMNRKSIIGELCFDRLCILCYRCMWTQFMDFVKLYSLVEMPHVEFPAYLQIQEIRKLETESILELQWLYSTSSIVLFFAFSPPNEWQ
jgi:hypothetical protein